MRHTHSKKGFTLIELLIVIGIIGFLAAAVLVAVDPVKRIQDSRDARRSSEANAILNAILTKQVDDRQLYGAGSDAPVITHATNSQVIVTSTAGIECDTSLTENYPGCNQTLDTSTRAVAGTVSNAADQLNGTGTNFLTSLRVGDTVIGTPGNGTCTIRSITSDILANCVASPTSAYTGATLKAFSKNCVVNLSDTYALVGTSTNTGTAVAGTGTNYLVQTAVGDTLTNGSTSCTVTAVASATALTCSPAPTWTGATLTVTKANSLTPTYIASVPLDPRGSGTAVCDTGCTTNAVGITTIGATNTGYYLHRTSGNRLEVGACAPEQASSINVKR